MKKTGLLFILLLLISCASNVKPPVATLQVSPQPVATPAVSVQPTAAPGEDFTLQVLHFADTHSRVDSTALALKMDIDAANKGCAVYINAGGYLLAADAVKNIRWQSDTLLLHSGDLVQGTLYFTRYAGETDLIAMNRMEPDAFVLGNHEFDKGPSFIQKMLLEKAQFPVLSANLDISGEKAITSREKLLPYVIKNFHGEQVAIIGLSLQDTPAISSPGPDIRFKDPAETAQAVINELTAKGINKIILITHMGLSEDIALAAKLSNVDLIAGGHSHSLTGNFTEFGLNSAAAYPGIARDKTGKDVLIVHAWEGAKVLGDIEITFNPAGEITNYTAIPHIVANRDWMRIYDLPGAGGNKKRVEFTGNGKAPAIREYDGKAYSVDIKDDPGRADDQYDQYKAAFEKVLAQMAAGNKFHFARPDAELTGQLKAYTAGLEQFRTEVVTTARDDLKRGLNKGPGPLTADSMLWKTGADLAANNTGGVRTDLQQGNITVANVYELMPFGNTLVVIRLTGADVVKTFEDIVDYQVTRYGVGEGNAYVYPAGIAFDLYPAAPKGERIRNARLKKGDVYQPLDPARIYKFAVNNFMAAGGDNIITLKNLTDKYDTGFTDAEIFMEYIKGKILTEADEKRINVKS